MQCRGPHAGASSGGPCGMSAESNKSIKKRGRDSAECDFRFVAPLIGLCARSRRLNMAVASR